MAFTIESPLTDAIDFISDTFVVSDCRRDIEHIANDTLFHTFNNYCSARFLEHFILQVAYFLNSRVVGTYAANQIDIAFVQMA